MTEDDAKKDKDELKDESSEVSSESDKQSSEITPEVKALAEQLAEKLAEKRASDILSKKGDKAKTLEDRVASLEQENQSLKDQRLADTATKHGLTLEDVKSLGLSTPEQIESIAKAFSKSVQETKEESKKAQTLTLDSGKTEGGSGELTVKQVKGMNTDQIVKNSKKISELPLSY